LFLHTIGVFNGHGVRAADFVHFLRGCVTRFFDHVNQKILDGHTLQLFGDRNGKLACADFPQYAQWLFPDTLLQLVMKVEFFTRRARVTLLEKAQAALQRLIADRHDHGRLADRLGKSRRCLAALSNDQLVRLGSILVTMAERLAESVDCNVDASLEGTRRLEQEFSRVRRTLNNNDTNDGFLGKITRFLNQDLDSPVAEPKVTDPARHSPVGGEVLRPVDRPDAIDLDMSPLEAQKIADNFMTVRPESCITSGEQSGRAGMADAAGQTTSAGRDRCTTGRALR
jgi:hypothetical protein